MIFVTVGTHEQPFNRLLEMMDELVSQKVIEEQVVIQTGYSTYQPKFCKSYKFLTYQEMWKYVDAARVVITHGGPSSFIMPLQIGKIPIVVPRQTKFNEHVNNHQLTFANEVAIRKRNIIVVDNIQELEDKIVNYDDYVAKVNTDFTNHNVQFNKDLQKIVRDLFPQIS